MTLTHNLGYPRIGEKRELKRATEAFWKGELSINELVKEGANLRKNKLAEAKRSRYKPYSCK